MSQTRPFDGTGKAELGDLYNDDSPNAYLDFLVRQDYQISNHGVNVLKLATPFVKAAYAKERIRVLDIGCSYGVLEAQARTDLCLTELHQLASGGAQAPATIQGLVRERGRYFSDVEFIGVDPADRAVAFAERSGLLAKGFGLSLETDDIPGEHSALFGGVDLVITTGAYGYITFRSFEKILNASADARPWFANFVLRGVSFDDSRTALGERGYVTERICARFRQRRFDNADEMAGWIAHLRKQGIDTYGFESTGYSYAELFISRPADRIGNFSCRLLEGV
jgi:hypothetical protein